MCSLLEFPERTQSSSLLDFSPGDLHNWEITRLCCFKQPETHTTGILCLDSQRGAAGTVTVSGPISPSQRPITQRHALPLSNCSAPAVCRAPPILGAALDQVFSPLCPLPDLPFPPPAPAPVSPWVRSSDLANKNNMAQYVSCETVIPCLSDIQT